MISELLRKWLGLDPIHCATCEVLREQLAKSERERADFIHRLLEKDKPEPSQPEETERVPIQPAYIPWRIRQQMLEAEDRQRAKILNQRTKEIDDLEKELGVAHDIERGESGGVIAEVRNAPE